MSVSDLWALSLSLSLPLSLYKELLWSFADDNQPLQVYFYLIKMCISQQFLQDGSVKIFRVKLDLGSFEKNTCLSE